MPGPLVPALIGAAGSLLGGAAAGGLFSGDSTGIESGLGDVRFARDQILNRSLFGNEKRGIPALNPSTPFSALNPGTGQVTIDPTARNLGLESYNQFSSALGDTRSALLGNQNAFERARVNPLLEQIMRSRGGLERELGRTDVRGTLRDRALTDFDLAGERALGDARSIAAQDTINTVNSLDQLLFNAGSGTGTNLFNQEMKSLGLGVDTITTLQSLANNLAVGAGGIGAQISGNQALIDQARTENITGAIGAGLSSFGDIFSASRTPAPNTNPGSLTTAGRNIFS